MEAYSYTSSSSSSNSSTYFLKEAQKLTNKPPPAYHSSLHSVRKHPPKLSKKPIAPLPPTPPKVYKVDSVDFKEIVQKLTGQQLPPEQPQRRLQDIAPPPLDLSMTKSALSDSKNNGPGGTLELFGTPYNSSNYNKTPCSATYRDLMGETLDGKSNKFPVMSPLAFTMSPSSLSWCASLLWSPGTLSSLEQGTVL